jgi:hypothetical protein
VTPPAHHGWAPPGATPPYGGPPPLPYAYPGLGQQLPPPPPAAPWAGTLVGSSRTCAEQTNGHRRKQNVFHPSPLFLWIAAHYIPWT